MINGIQVYGSKRHRAMEYEKWSANVITFKDVTVKNINTPVESFTTDRLSYNYNVFEDQINNSILQSRFQRQQQPC